MNKISNYLPTIVLILIICLGIYLRLDQFLVQILIDDEWHAVHKLIKSTPEKFIKTFGHADYSIPLTLLYWFEAKYFGLSELLMRWPMMLFGLVTLILFPLFAKKKFNWSVTLIFAFFIATSPLLIHYSRIARPYAITLFLVYFSIVLFYKYYNCKDKTFFFGFVYAIAASLALWLHLIIGFFLITPFVIEFIRIIINKSNNKFNRFLKLLYLGLPTLGLMLLLILPPLLNDMAALSSKAGSNLPTLNTLTGFLYLCYGTSSTFLVMLFSVLTLIALPHAINKSAIILNILVGFCMTVLAINMAQPAWVQNPITFTRYLLPIIPVLLFLTAIGFNVVFKAVKSRLQNKASFFVLVAATVILIPIWYKAHSPITEWLRQPNTNTLHSLYSIDFRKGKNIIQDILTKRPVSPFWKSLSGTPLKHKIVVAPWYFESYSWDGPIWEKISKQYVLPGYMTGLCFKKRAGETPKDPRFKFENMGLIADKNALNKKHIDYVIFQKSKRFNYVVRNIDKIDKCLSTIKDYYGQPIYEDDLIAVFTPTQ